MWLVCLTTCMTFGNPLQRISSLSSAYFFEAEGFSEAVRAAIPLALKWCDEQFLSMDQRFL